LFNGYLQPMLAGLSQNLTQVAASLHEGLHGFRTHILSLAVFLSAGTTLLVTPAVSLLTRPHPEAHKAIWSAFVIDARDEEDDFHVIPASGLGRAGLALVAIGFIAFLAGVFSAPCGVLAAGTLAIGGMIVVFVGGLMRVHAH
jgi:hypothetical protein